MEIDVEINREGFDSEKYELRQKLFGTEDLLPLWVADQDLSTPKFILDAIKHRLEHPILGYSVMPDRLYQAIIDWQAQYGYQVKAEEILFTHNVANGFHMAVQALTEPGDTVLVQSPVYPPFLSAPVRNQRNLVEIPLQLNQGRYEMDWSALESAMIEHKPSIFLFCHPQNPSGRVWRRDELMRLGDLCLRHGVRIVSDEIHADLTFKPNHHVPMATVSSEIADITITLNSPGKTFNLGGLQCGYAIAKNKSIRTRFKRALRSASLLELNLFASVAMQAAYSEEGLDYRDALLELFGQHVDRVNEFFKAYAPNVKVMNPEASFLLWIDFRALFDNPSDLKHWMINECKLGLNEGLSFGDCGAGFMRMNIAISSERLTLALERLRKGLEAL